MTDSTQPHFGLGKKLSVGILAAALFALLAFTPFASAGPPSCLICDPIASGTAAITLNNGTLKQWKKYGVKLTATNPAELSGNKATFTVTDGQLAPIDGRGNVNLDGGLKFKVGKKSVALEPLVLNTKKKALSVDVGGKKIATFINLSFARNGFGVNLKVPKLELTSSAAKQLNKKLGFTGKKSAVPFKANQVIGSASSETQPSTVIVLPNGNVSFAPDVQTLSKLAEVGVVVSPIGPGAEPKKGELAFPIKGGPISPTATAGSVETSGGLNLFQKLGSLETTVTLSGFRLDYLVNPALTLSYPAKTVDVEVSAKSNASKSLDLGAIGRGVGADMTSVGTVTSNATTRTVTVIGTTVKLQEVTAMILNGFSQIAQDARVKQLEGAPENKSKADAERQAAEEFANKHIKTGDPLGTFSFTAQTH